MKEFEAAVEDIAYDDEREARIVALVAEGKTRQEAEAETEPFIEFKLGGRVMKAYQPTDGQLTFMLAALGRGQSDDGRFASILNIMFECLDPADKDYIEGRLLSRDPKKRLSVKKIEEIFEYLVGEWFARPTQPASTSAR